MSHFYFAWSGQFDEWGPAMLVEDEQIFSILVDHTENNLPSLKIDIRNPRVGLLSAGRNVWCWLSYAPDDGLGGLGPAIPIFRGRLIGVQQNLQDEVASLQFIARPVLYQEEKGAIAERLKVPPYWDPVWLQSKVDDPDTALESRTVLWHTDRVSLDVSVSDIIKGEDGLVDVNVTDHFYDAMTITYGQAPLHRASMTGTVTWDQTGAGSVDLTRPLVAAFQAAGSPLPSPLICSLTADGLLSSWPTPGTSIGGGWSLNPDSFAELVDWLKPERYTKTFLAKDPMPAVADLPAAKDGDPPLSVSDPVPSYSIPGEFTFPWANLSGLIAAWAVKPPDLYSVLFPVTILQVLFLVDWNAKRSRSETVAFTLQAGIQSIIVNPGVDEDATVDLSSAAITQPIDPGGATPLYDTRSPTYFKTARGKQSIEYLLVLARAKLLSRARCVLIKFATRWDFVIAWISCRYSVRLYDPRLPGGVAIGKITGYQLSFSTNGIGAEVTIACAIGHGGSTAGATGAPTYAATGYMAPGYAAETGATVAAVPGEVVYSSLDDFTLTDDGVDLFNLTAGNALVSTPALFLATTGNVLANSPKITALASTEGLLNGETYTITGIPGIVGLVDFVFDGKNGGTLSKTPPVTLTFINVTISAPATNGFTVTNGIAKQTIIVDDAVTAPMPDPVNAVKAAPTRVCVDLVGTEGGTFHTDFLLKTEVMSVPRQIDLEAP